MCVSPTFKLFLIVVKSSYPVFCLFSESGYYRRDKWHYQKFTNIITIIKKLFVFFSITTLSGLRCFICLSTWIKTCHRIFTISFSITDSSLVRTTFQILLLHTACIRPNRCLNIPYLVFYCTISVLTYCNHSLCAEHSPNVFHIILIYLIHPYDTFF